MLGRRAWISPPPSRIAVEGGDSCGPQSPFRLDTGVGLAPGPLPPPPEPPWAGRHTRGRDLHLEHQGVRVPLHAQEHRRRAAHRSSLRRRRRCHTTSQKWQTKRQHSVSPWQHSPGEEHTMHEHRTPQEHGAKDVRRHTNSRSNGKQRNENKPWPTSRTQS